jgi:hypothetical protein
LAVKSVSAFWAASSEAFKRSSEAAPVLFFDEIRAPVLFLRVVLV